MSIAALVASGPLRMGATGPAVAAVQLALRNAGDDLEADGGFGTITKTALKAFEASHGLQSDVPEMTTRTRADAFRTAFTARLAENMTGVQVSHVHVYDKNRDSTEQLLRWSSRLQSGNCRAHCSNEKPAKSYRRVFEFAV